MAGIVVRNLTRQFEGGISAVQRINFEVADGQVLTLLGPSGCGKTTTLRMLAGLEVPDLGEVAFGDRLVSSTERKIFVSPEKRDVGMVFQSYAIWPHMTVYENVAYPLSIRSISKQELQQRVQEVIEMLGLVGLEKRSAARLSGGQQQRVAIARALVGRPALLLLDEPLSNLDAKLRAHMRVELLQLHRRLGNTTVYVTHDQVEALMLSDRVLVMNEGVIQQAGTPRDIFTKPANRFVADFVGFANFLPGEVVESGPMGTLVKVGADATLLRVNNGLGAGVGAEVLVGARPNSLRLEHPSHLHNGEPVLEGEVLSEAYMGEFYEYHVRGTDSTPLVINVPEQDLAGLAERPRIGDRVGVRFNPQQTITLPA